MEYFKIDELQQMFFDYFTNNCDYVKIKGASLVPSSDNSVLFTPAGMHPLIPYLTGIEKHPEGNKLANVQNVVRTGAINRVGDDSFLTFFELFGLWVIGEYNKQDVFSDIWKFLTEILKIPQEKLYMTYFEGNDMHDKDIDTLTSWKNIGIKENHLCSTINNWKGPYSYEKICGPNTRIFYDTGKEKCSHECTVTCNCGKYVELWDVVFFDYNFKNKRLERSFSPCVDMGAGVERLAALIQGVNTIYETDKMNIIVNMVKSQVDNINALSDINNIKKCRIIADHLRCACFIIGDEISTVPSNKGRGYVLRKILRRTINLTNQLGITFDSYMFLINKIIDMYKKTNPNLESKREFIMNEIYNEYNLYENTIKNNLIKIVKELKYKEYITNEEIEILFDRYGVPVDIIKYIVIKNKILVRSKI